MKSIEKLRKVAEEQSSPVMCKLVRAYTGKDVMGVSNAEVMEALGIAIDEIEEELNGYMELPKDVNGNPIHVGDVLIKMRDGRDTDIQCVAQGVGDDSVFVSYEEEEGNYGLVSYNCLSSAFRLKGIDSWEQIIKEAYMRGVNAQSDEDARISCVSIPDDYDLVARCRVLAGTEE